jgi:hypothetical protein
VQDPCFARKGFEHAFLVAWIAWIALNVPGKMTCHD